MDYPECRVSGPALCSEYRSTKRKREIKDPTARKVTKVSSPSQMYNRISNISHERGVSLPSVGYVHSSPHLTRLSSSRSTMSCTLSEDRSNGERRSLLHAIAGQHSLDTVPEGLRSQVISSMPPDFLSMTTEELRKHQFRGPELVALLKQYHTWLHDDPEKAESWKNQILNADYPIRTFAMFRKWTYWQTNDQDKMHTYTKKEGNEPLPDKVSKPNTNGSGVDSAVMLPVVTSYWSVPEQQSFRQLVAYYGRDYNRIADLIKTKSQAMVRNHYTREISKGDSDLERLAQIAEDKLARSETL